MASLPLDPRDLLLMLVWFCVPLWNTAVGPTGGVTFAAMAAVLPPTAAIPVQAVLEAGSGALRIWLLRDWVDVRFAAAFAMGGILGFASSFLLRLVATPSEDLLRIVMGSFVLASCWLPSRLLRNSSRAMPTAVGAGSSFISLFTGGVAPVIASAIGQRHAEPRRVIGTLTACLLYQHGAKTILFGLLGFSFAAYGRLLVLLFAAAAAGTLVGRRVLVQIPERTARVVLKSLLTVLGSYVLLRGLFSALGPSTP